MPLKLFFVISSYTFIGKAISRFFFPLRQASFIGISFFCPFIPPWSSELNSYISLVFLTSCIISCDWFFLVSFSAIYITQAVLYLLLVLLAT